MPDKAGELVDVVNSNRIVIPEVPDYNTQAQTLRSANAQTFKDGVAIIRQGQKEINHAVGQHDALTRELEQSYKNLQQDRWIDYLFGKEFRELVGFFDDTYSDSKQLLDIKSISGRRDALKTSIAAKKDAIATTRDILKTTTRETRAANKALMEADVKTREQKEKIIRNSSYQQLVAMQRDPRFADMRGLIIDEMADAAETLVQSLPEAQVAALAKESKDPIIKSAAQTWHNELTGKILDNEYKRRQIEGQRLGNISNAENLTKQRRENVLSTSSIPTLRAAMEKAEGGYAKIGDFQYSVAELQGEFNKKYEVRKQFGETEIEAFDIKHDIENLKVGIGYKLNRVAQADIQLPPELVAEYSRFKQMAGVPNLLNSHGGKIRDDAKQLQKDVDAAVDKAIENIYPTKKAQASVHDFIDNGRIDNAANASYMLMISRSPTMGARDGSVFETPMAMLNAFIREDIDSSYIVNGEVDIEKLAKDKNIKMEDMMANYIQNSGARAAVIDQISTNYFFDAIKRFERAHPEAVGISPVRETPEGNMELDSTTFMYRLYELTGDDKYVKAFLNTYGDREYQEKWANEIKSNVNVSEAAFLKATLENRFQNILVKDYMNMASDQMQRVVADRFQQTAAASRRVQDRNEEYFNNIKAHVDYLIDHTPLSQDDVLKRTQLYTEAFKFSDRSLQSLNDYISMRMVNRDNANNPQIHISEGRIAEFWQNVLEGLLPNMERYPYQVPKPGPIGVGRGVGDR